MPFFTFSSGLKMKSAATRALVAVALGIFLSGIITLPWWIAVIAIGLGLLLSRGTKGLSLYLVLIFAAFIYAHSRYPASLPQLKNKSLISQGVVTIEPLGSNRITVSLLPPRHGKITIWLKDSTPKLRYGDLVMVSKEIQPLSFPSNPGLIDYNRYLKQQGFVGSASVSAKEIKIIGKNLGNPLLRILVMPARRYLFRVINQVIGGDESSLLLGILLGDKTSLPEPLRSTFTATGLWHLMAVSGLHIGVVIGALWLLLAAIGIRGWWRFITLTSAAFFYALIAGFNPAPVRAALMTLALLLSIPLQRRSTPLVNLSVAGIIILLLDPLALFNTGAQLSFAATMAIITIVPKVQNLFQRLKPHRLLRRYLLLPTAASLAATVGIAPLSLYHFYQFQPLTFLSNLLVLPIVSLTLPLALLVALVNLACPALAGIPAQSLKLLLSIIPFLLNHLGRLRVLLIEPGKLPLSGVFFIYGLLILLLNWRRTWAKTAFRILFAAVITFVIWKSALTRPRASVTFLDPLRGDAVLIEDTLGRKLLIDAGIDKTDVLPDLLLSRGIKRIDAAIITHPDRDHYGGLIDLTPDIKINHLIVPTLKGDTRYQKLLRQLESTGTKITVAGQGAQLSGFGYYITLLWPDELTRWLYQKRLIPSNSISIVTLIEYQGFNMLFTGDCESYDVITSAIIDKDIFLLKSPHHGSKKGNPLALYQTVRPEYAVVLGRNPTPARLEQNLPRLGIKYINTRRDGGVILKFNNRKPAFSRN
ncbi:MAG: DNA internalization-related competence protein ComEC/Rec2 [bacterium]